MNKSELQAKLSTLEKQVANAPANARPLMQSAIEKIKGQIQELEGSEVKPSAPEKTTTARGKGRPKGTTKPKKEVEKKGRGRPKKEVTPEVKPITETQINKVAKDIREEGEPMIRARKRAKKALVEIKDVAKDTAKMESKGKLTKAKIMAEIKKLNKVFANLGIDIQVDSADDLFRDATRTALPKGWRTSKNGKEYYENRPNRSDSLQNTPVYSKLKLAQGGMMGKTRVGTYEGKDAVKGEVIGTFVADNGTNIELVSSKDSDSSSGRMYYVAINGRGLYAREYREDAYELYRDEIEKYKMKFAKGGMMDDFLLKGVGKSGLDKMVSYSKENPFSFFLVTEDDNSNIRYFYLVNGNLFRKSVQGIHHDISSKRNVVKLMPKSDAVYEMEKYGYGKVHFAEGGFMSGGVSDYELDDWFDFLPESSKLLYMDADTYEEAEEIWSDMDYDSKLELYLSVGYSDGDDEEYEEEYEEEYAKGGTTGKKYMVFNYTDDIYASNDVFKTKKEANDFIKSFRKRYEGQGYYRDNRMNKIDIEDIDLMVIPSDFNPFPYKGFAKGGEVGFKERCEMDSVKIAKAYNKVLESNFSDKEYEIYQKVVKDTGIPKAELQKIEFYLNTTPKGKQRMIDIYQYWGMNKYAKGGEMTYKMTEEKIYT
jgi:hypothetical protein